MNQAEWMTDYRSRLARERVPVSVTLELTRRCNLRCIHCYLGSQEVQHEVADGEMSTEQVKQVINEIVAAGCLYLLITGGDAMMRRDFADIYRYAREQGLVVAVFCDGVLVSDAIIDLFREYPPQAVEISLYGATAETYEEVTRVKHSFERCLRGIRRLVDAGIRTNLKTVLMTVNAHEYEAMRRIADDFGASFRSDSAIFPCLPNGDREPMDLRIDPKVAVEKELSNPEAVRNWHRYMDERKDVPPRDDLYVCGAGITSFFIDPFGWVSPCLMTTHERYNLFERGLDALWNGELARLHDRRPRDGYACTSCEMRTACSGCPAFNYQETGEEDVLSPYVCATTVERWQRLQQNRNGGLPVYGQSASGGG